MDPILEQFFKNNGLKGSATVGIKSAGPEDEKPTYTFTTMKELFESYDTFKAECESTEGT